MNGRNGGFHYRECTKNHALAIGKHAVDGCGEFMPAGEEGTLEAFNCAACNCHRNFHRKVPIHHHNIAPPPPYYYHYQHPLALPSASRNDLEENSNPSSSGTKKRFRTKFTQDQKDLMLHFAMEIGWHLQKENEAAVQHFCEETGINRQVLKVWMHNNKHTLGKKP